MAQLTFSDESIEGQAHFVLTRSFDARIGKMVVHKRPNAINGNAEAACRILQHEYAVLQRLKGVHGVPQAVRLNMSTQELVTCAIDGTRLDDLGWVGKLQTANLLRFALATLRVLEAIHERGVLHLSLSPRRIRLLGDAERDAPGSPAVAIVGFGHAALPGGAEAAFFEGGTPVSLLSYAAPESTGRMLRRIDQRADLYAFGVVLYELACGKLPFDEVNPLALTHAHLARVPALAHQVRPGVPPRLSAILARLLRKEPEHRHSSANELIHELAELQLSLETSTYVGAFAGASRHAGSGASELQVPGAADRQTLRVASALLQSLDASGAVDAAEAAAASDWRSASLQADQPAVDAFAAHLRFLGCMKSGAAACIEGCTDNAATVGDASAMPGARCSAAVTALEDLYALLVAIMHRDVKALSSHAPQESTRRELNLDPYLAAMYQFAIVMALSLRVELFDIPLPGVVEPLRQRLILEIQRFRKLGASQPGSFSHLLHLAAASQTELEGRPFESARHHDEAMTLANRKSRLWHEALVTEHAGRFQLKHGFQTGSRRLLQRSAAFYRRWGAEKKLRLMREEFPFVVLTMLRDADLPLAAATGWTSAIADRQAVLQASQALASETDLTRLVTRMVEVIEQLAGATAAAVFFNDEQEGWLLAGARRDSTTVTGLPLPAEAARHFGFPSSVFIRSLANPQSELIASATKDPRFADDPALADVECCSVLLMPIRSKGRTRAVLLLENRLSSGFFTGKDLDTLELIAGSLSTSIENALLYGSLEKRVAQRTHDLERITLEMQLRDRALASTTNALSAVFDLSPDGFVVVDKEGFLSIANPAFEAMTGLQASTLIGKSVPAFEALLAERTEPEARYAKARPDLLHIRKPQARTLIRRVRNGESPGLETVMYFRDVTREMEIDRMKTDFLSTTAHELRSPVTIIYGFTELVLKREMSAEERGHMLKTIHRQAGALVSLINELLDLARIEARRGNDFHYSVQSLRPIVADTLAAIEPIGANRQVTLQQIATPIWVNVDAERLSNVVTNILSNAIKYSSRGDIGIDFVSRQNRDRDEVGVRITDQGIGMSAIHLLHLFERFFRVDSSGRIPGTGLGTTIAKEIVELHGGELIAESQLGVGTAMTIWLPRQRPPLASNTGGAAEEIIAA